MDVTGQLINQEDGPRTLARDGVLDGPIAFVGIRMDLRRQEEGRVDTGEGGGSSPTPSPAESRGPVPSTSLLQLTIESPKAVPVPIRALYPHELFAWDSPYSAYLP